MGDVVILCGPTFRSRPSACSEAMYLAVPRMALLWVGFPSASSCCRSVDRRKRNKHDSVTDFWKERLSAECLWQDLPKVV